MSAVRPPFALRFQRGYHVDEYVVWAIYVRLFGRDFFIGREL